MIDLINSWAQGLIIAVIISVIIEMILPEGNNKKYIKVVLGVYILFSMVYPIINAISKRNISLNTIITSTNKEMKKYEMNNISLQTNSYIESTYKENLEKNIKQEINDKGYKILDLKLYIELENSERYGQINSIVINIENLKEVQQVSNAVEEIKIDISNKQESIDKENISQEEIDSLKEYFVNAYAIEKERIHINE